MPSLSNLSQQRLLTCDPRLQEVLNEAIKYVDFTILCGHRGAEEQNEAYAKGASTKQWPNSKHNRLPSVAVDVAPWFPDVKIDWKDIAAFARLAGYIQRIADERGIKLRWGGDWDGDWRTVGRDPDERFLDAPHLELAE